jgi:hypothetical protein
MTIYKTEVQMPDSGVSHWIIHLALDENDSDKMSTIEFSYSNKLRVTTATLITEDENGRTHYDDMEYTLLRYDAENDFQAGMFTVRPSLYPTIKLTVLVEQKLDYISVEIKRETCYGNDIENDADIQSE